MLTRLAERGLTLNEEKFRHAEGYLHGFTSVKQWYWSYRRPQIVTEVKSFLGLVNFNARFIQDFATIAEPMRRLTKGDVTFVFGPEQ